MAVQVVKSHAPRELLLDLDAPEAHLADYARWVDAVRHAVPGVTLTITALPAWLAREDDFQRLVRAADGFVLQVHSLEPPRGPRRPVALCDPARARGWVERTAHAGVPFRVALPAYGYRARFDGTLLAADGLGGFAQTGATGRSVALVAAPARIVRPGETLTIGWFRFTAPPSAPTATTD